jgi:hypothetical protein
MGSLNATFVLGNEEDGVVVVGFADEEFQTVNHVLLQRSLHVDDDDRSHGLDRIHVQLNLGAGERSCYGKLNSCQWNSNSVKLILDTPTSIELGCPTEVTINIHSRTPPSPRFWECFSILLNDVPVDDKRATEH